ncbi:MAG: aminotransferase class III-fold pyridoxal phosphate-dependent enzyme [Candidatus Omnitrophica bacterium]|nr:aminotransferase class III-fold pyridoxal phosphate-dependent enzyme [Candidatus Omnitrophota bacterium]
MEPDIVTLAKGLGTGVPIGAMMARKEIMEHLTPGSMAAPSVATPGQAAAVATLETLFEEDYLSRIQELSRHCSKASAIWGRKIPPQNQRSSAGAD